MVESDLIKLMHEIKQNYGNREYQRRSGDFYFENVPEDLWKLWYSDRAGSLAVSNIDSRFDEARRGMVSMDEFYALLSELVDALSRQFENIDIDKANLQKGGKSAYEGS